MKRGKKSGVAVAAVSLLIIMIVALFVLPKIPPYINESFQGGSSVSSSSSSTISSSSSQNFSVLSSNPCISNGTVSYPANYVTLVSYALNIINTNRTNFGLHNVTLSEVPSGQQHADSMLSYGYFSHWDTAGCKPYMRYMAFGGTGYVEENIAYEYQSCNPLSGCPFTSASGVEKAINTLEWQMIYNDSKCCQNGHAKNILNPYHTSVSIGISYNSTTVFFVEDFENYNMSLSIPYSSSVGTITFNGAANISVIPNMIFVFYDKTPTPLSATTLNTQSPYDGPYTAGTFLGNVVPPQNILCGPRYGSVTECAEMWSVNATSVDIQFSLSQFVNYVVGTNSNGSGVYTLYLLYASGSYQNYNASLTSISIFVSG